jgi:hypothetical protein
MILKWYFLYHQFLDEISTTKSCLSTVKQMELRCFLYGINELERCLSYHLILMQFQFFKQDETRILMLTRFLGFLDDALKRFCDALMRFIDVKRDFSRLAILE